MREMSGAVCAVGAVAARSVAPTGKGHAHRGRGRCHRVLEAHRWQEPRRSPAVVARSTSSANSKQPAYYDDTPPSVNGASFDESSSGVTVGPGGYCSPRHRLAFDLRFLSWNGIL